MSLAFLGLLLQLCQRLLLLLRLGLCGSFLRGGGLGLLRRCGRRGIGSCEELNCQGSLELRARVASAGQTKSTKLILQAGNRSGAQASASAALQEEGATPGHLLGEHDGSSVRHKSHKRVNLSFEYGVAKSSK